MGNSNNFEFTGKMKRNLMALMAFGVVAIVIHLAILGFGHSTGARIWANLLIDTMFFLGISLLGLFFVATHSMALGGWYILIRRIPEAISGWILPGSLFLLVIALGTFSGWHHLYHWTDDFIVADTVTVEQLRAYEVDLLEHDNHDDHDDHGDEHGDEHGALDGHSNSNADKLLASSAAITDATLQQAQEAKEETINVLKKGANKAADAAEQGAEAVGDGVEKVIDVLKKGGDKVVETAEGAGAAAGDAVDEILHGDGHEDHGHDGNEPHGDAHHAASDGEHDGHGSDADHGSAAHGASSHSEGHGGDHDDHGDGHAAAGHGDHNGHGAHADDDYNWYHGKVSGHVEHHGHMIYAQNYTGEVASKKIANPHFDVLIHGKRPYLNRLGFLLRTLIYIFLWVFFWNRIRSLSLTEDKEGGLKWYHKSKVYSAIFMIVFGVTTAMASWDFLMSIDPHWFSTLYAWYMTCSVWVACLAFTILIVTFLKDQGYLPQVNENHLHDVAKYMFGFSVFWTYLWFSQYMLYWYSNIPEETMYFHVRNGSAEFKLIFFMNLFVNFFTPFFVLMTRGAKRHMRVIRTVAVILIFGHWLDMYLAIVPGASGVRHLGLLEVGMFALFLGMFLFVVLRELSKASLIPQKHPFYKESVTHTT